MSSGDTVKTTVRLPADLHWQFQGERAKRRLSNEKAISEAFAFWIAHPEPSSSGASKQAHSRRNHLLPANPHEKECVEILLHILRDRDNPARAAALRAVLEALSSRNWEEHAEKKRSGISAPGSDDLEKRVEQLYQNAKHARRGPEGTGVPESRVGAKKT
jgi:hypothetical protein